ncbi:MAG: MFS transporter, partial [Caulobacteraceae bacterium]|nr:MFS transporter [Caulobacteraceae bacterium]
LALAGGLGVLILAVRVNARPDQRLLPLQATRPGAPAGAGYALIFTAEIATIVINVYEAAILQTVYRVNPLVAGYVVCSMAVGWTLAAFAVSGQPERRHGRFIVAGAMIIALADCGLALLIGRAPLGVIAAAGAIMGAGFGLSWAFVTQRILSALPLADRASGSSAVPTTQLIGGAVGAAAAGATANLLGLTQVFTPERAEACAPWLFGAFAPFAFLSVWAAVRVSSRWPGLSEAAAVGGPSGGTPM